MIDVFNNIAVLASYIHTTTRNNSSIVTNKVSNDRRPLHNNSLHRIASTQEDIDTWNQIKEYNR